MKKNYPVLHSVFFMSFDSDKTMLSYYESRRKYMTRIYIMCASAKTGHIWQVVSALSYKPEFHRADRLILNLYPDTDEGDAAVKQALIVALI